MQGINPLPISFYQLRRTEKIRDVAAEKRAGKPHGPERDWIAGTSEIAKERSGYRR